MLPKDEYISITNTCQMVSDSRTPVPKSKYYRAMPRPDRYLIEAAARAFDVLELFNHQDDIRLSEVVEKLDLVKSTAFRLLYTLEAKGFIERSANGRSYRKRRRYRVGMLSVSRHITFASEVEHGIEVEARRAGLELVIRHHEFDSSRLIKEAKPCSRKTCLSFSATTRTNICLTSSPTVAPRRVCPSSQSHFPFRARACLASIITALVLAGGEGLGEQIGRQVVRRLDRVVVLDIPEAVPHKRRATRE